jgi:transketolase
MINTKIIDDDVEYKAVRDGFGEALVEMGEKDERIVVLTADVAESTRVDKFAKKFPKRFIECGVAEQNMMGIAAGLAAAGKIPWVASYAVFSPGRSWDQLRVAVCYSNLNVKIAGCHTGLTVGPDGATHQALEDIAITRVLPNMTVVSPCDYLETKKAVVAASNSVGPVYLRLGREKVPVITSPDSRFEISKANIVFQCSMLSDQVAIFTCGSMVYPSLIAAKELESEGVGCVVINNHTIKPMDKEAILEVAKKVKGMVTVEEHQVAGGLGSAVAELLIDNGQLTMPMRMVGMRDKFGESGKPQELLDKYGMNVEGIKEAVYKVIKRLSD